MRRVKLLRLKDVPIRTQLHLEEAIFRKDPSHTWIILNNGSNPAVVMGLSGKLPELVNTSAAKADRIPVYRRFTGGGTVFVDEETVFVSLIGNEEFLRRDKVQLFPREIMSWTESFYRPVFQELPNFRLEETDYVFGHRKFGGNAQRIGGVRWLHHSALLWDYEEGKMNKYLLHPKKQPKYRAERPHGSFLCKLQGNMRSVSSKEELEDRIERAMVDILDHQIGDSLQEVDFNHALSFLDNFTISTEDVEL